MDPLPRPRAGIGRIREEPLRRQGRGGCGGAEGDVEKLKALLEEQPSTAKRPGNVEHVQAQFGEPKGAEGFEER